MKKILSTNIKLVILSCILLMSLNKVNAQFNIGGPGTNGSGIYANGAQNQGGSGGPAVPFDGGMSIMLIAAGISYSSKKLKKQKDL